MRLRAAFPHPLTRSLDSMSSQVFWAFGRPFKLLSCCYFTSVNSALPLWFRYNGQVSCDFWSFLPLFFLRANTNGCSICIMNRGMVAYRLGITTQDTLRAGEGRRPVKLKARGGRAGRLALFRNALDRKGRPYSGIRSVEISAPVAGHATLDSPPDRSGW